MNDYPAPGWMFYYFLVPSHRFVTAIEYQSIIRVSKGTAYRQLYDFHKFNLVERKRVTGPGGRESWGYRRMLCRIVYNQDILNKYSRAV